MANIAFPITSTNTARQTQTTYRPAGKPEIKIFDIRYVGWVKKRSDGSQTAFGWSGGEWSVIFTKSVLYEWFGMDERPQESATLYQVLCVKPEATAEEIKTNYRRLAKQWHTDICKEKDARQQFEAIQHAYEILRDENKRARYNAGLALVANSTVNREMPILAYNTADLIYRPPLRCGMLLCEVQRSGKKWLVNKILQWEDITNWAGQTLVTSWRMGDDKPTEVWS